MIEVNVGDMIFFRYDFYAWDSHGRTSSILEGSIAIVCNAWSHPSGTGETCVSLLSTEGIHIAFLRSLRVSLRVADAVHMCTVHSHDTCGTWYLKEPNNMNKLSVSVLCLTAAVAIVSSCTLSERHYAEEQGRDYARASG